MSRPVRSVAIRRCANVLAVVLLVAIGARLSFSIPGAAVPQSLQTLAVVVAGALLGPVWGAIGILAYVVVGGLGVPVFADGASGFDVVTGPSLGYLAGFILAASCMGAAVRRQLMRRDVNVWKQLLIVFFAALLAHGLILGAGGLRLALLVGWTNAFVTGVAPFVAGALVKSAAAALVLQLFNRFSRSAH